MALLLAQILPVAHSPTPYTQPYNGVSLSQFSGVETETPEKKALVKALSQSEVARVCPRKVSTTGWALTCLRHGRLVSAPMLFLRARPQASPFLSCAGTAGAGLHLLSSLPQSHGKWVSWTPFQGLWSGSWSQKRCLKTCPCHQMYFTGF